MRIDERTTAIRRAKRALKALTEHPDTTRQQLGAARDRLNDCYRLTDADRVWEAVGNIETIAAAVYGVPAGDEPAPRAWVAGSHPAAAPALLSLVALAARRQARASGSRVGVTGRRLWTAR